MTLKFITRKSEDTAIDDYLKTIMPDSDRLTNLLITTLRKPLNNESECIYPITELPKDAPVWLQEEWSKKSIDGYPRDPENKDLPLYHLHIAPPVGSQTDVKVHMIARWMRQIDQEGKLKTDKEGRRPLALIGIESLDEAIVSIGSFIKQDKGRTPPLDMPRKGYVMEWPGDCHIMQKQTVDDIFNAQEGLLNQRLEVKDDYIIACMKQEIEAKMIEGHKFFTLYGQHDEIHPRGESALIEISAGGQVLSCVGRQHQPATEPMMDYVKQFIESENFDLDNIKTKWTELIKINGHYYNALKLKEELPSGMVIPGDLDLSGIKHSFELPDNLNVEGDLLLRGCHIKALPDNLNVRGNVVLSRTKIKNLGNNKEFHGNLDISNTNISGLNDGTHIHGNLNITGAEKISRLPNAKGDESIRPKLTVYGNIELNRTITESEQNRQMLLDDIRNGNIEIHSKGLLREPLGKIVEKPKSYITAYDQAKANRGSDSKRI